MLPRQGKHRSEYFRQWSTKVLAAVRSQQDNPLVRRQVQPVRHLHPGNGQQCIDNGVTSDESLLGSDAFMQERLACPCRRREMQGGEAAGENPIHFLRERVTHVAGAQARLNVTKGNVPIKGSQCRRQYRGGVALRQDGSRAFRVEGRIERYEQAAGEIGKLLTGTHDAQVDIGLDAKKGEGFVQHFAMLHGRHHPDARPGSAPQRQDYWSHLDGFRTSTDDTDEIRNHVQTVMPGRRAVIGRDQS